MRDCRPEGGSCAARGWPGGRRYGSEVVVVVMCDTRCPVDFGRDCAEDMDALSAIARGGGECSCVVYEPGSIAKDDVSEKVSRSQRVVDFVSNHSWRVLDGFWGV